MKEGEVKRGEVQLSEVGFCDWIRMICVCETGGIWLLAVVVMETHAVIFFFFWEGLVNEMSNELIAGWSGWLVSEV